MTSSRRPQSLFAPNPVKVVALSPEDLFSKMDGDSKMVLLDCRSPKSYNKGHIHRAHSLSKMVNGKRDLIASQSIDILHSLPAVTNNSHIVLYDDESNTLDNFSNLFAAFIQSIVEKDFRVSILKGQLNVIVGVHRLIINMHRWLCCF